MARLPNGYASAPKRLLVLGSIRFVRPLNPPSRGLSCANTSDFAASFTILGDKGTHDRLFCRPFQRALKPGMDILRPPPGHQDDEAPPPRRNPFIRLVFAVLFLVIGMVVFFIGGLVVRNPELPNYLLDQIVRRFQSATAHGTTSGKANVSSSENLKPPPPPTTPEQYLNLMSYDERTLPPDERAAASVLNQNTVTLEDFTLIRWATEVDQLMARQIIPGFAKIQPGSDVTDVRAAIEKCSEKAKGVTQFYQDLPEQIAGKLISAGVSNSLAHQTGQFFAERAQSQKNISAATELSLACKSMTTLVDLLVKPPANWKRDSTGTVMFTTWNTAEQFNAASKEFTAHFNALYAVFKTIGGG